VDAHQPAHADDRDALGSQQNGEDGGRRAGENLVPFGAKSRTRSAPRGAPAMDASRRRPHRDRLVRERYVWSEIHSQSFIHRREGEICLA
jgi:hypothetical protein